MRLMGSNQAIPTIWIFGDQLDPSVGPLADFGPGECRVLFVESRSKIESKRWHRQRLHVVLSGMAHLARELTSSGFEVDHRRAPDMTTGLQEHVREFAPSSVIAMAPMSWSARRLLERLGVDLVPNGQFACHENDFAQWLNDRGIDVAAAPKSLKQEDFYRFQRRRLDLLMDGDQPEGGQWNFDHDNREPPPDDGRAWPPLDRFDLDDLDLEVIDRFPDDVWGAPPDGTWPVTRTQARQRLDEFIEHGLPVFGPHEDAMLSAEWKLAHSALSSSLNLGLLHPVDVVEAAESAFRAGRVPIASAEGFVRQVIGWREYVWGLFWAWMPEYAASNGLGADRPVPPAFTGEAATAMRCVASTVGHLHDRGYTHHIERLMVIGNLALTHGVDPQALTDWMWASFVDGAEWVMVPNVIGMALHADGGRMATKPYASGGAYLDRMSDFCGDCRFDPKKRTGSTACPFTTLYWDFLARNEAAFTGNHRMARQLAAMRRLSNLAAVREHAVEIRRQIDEGTL